MFRFRRFSARLLVLLLGLLFAALAATYLFVSRANLANALNHSEANLEVGARIYDDAIAQQIASLADSARVLTSDYPIRQVLQTDPLDVGTLSSILRSFTRRVHAPVIALIDTDGKLVANSDSGMENENIGPFRALIGTAAKEGQPQASGFSYLRDELHVLVAVPLYAPEPEIAYWLGLAFPIDQKFAARIKDTTGIDVTFVSAHPPRALATTLPAASVAAVTAAVAEHHRTVAPAQFGARAPNQLTTLPLADDDYVTLFKSQDLLDEDPVVVVLQRPLRTELAAARELEGYLLQISLAALALAALAALWLARGVSQPVLALAAHTKVVATGDYTQRLVLDRADELGQLATAFNAMTLGLAERDRVRDLLDKNVSPEIAAQLMRDGSALGGEEREVTILFADLRGFTTLSEKLPPPELLALLNRYLDRMSRAIEAHGGVIDKFIGDAIMALFGAPVAQSDAPARALAAALAMESALIALNAELAAESACPLSTLDPQLSTPVSPPSPLPPRLTFGIGVNTARVIAGNIGSHRRLNYSVIGDGVNVAARLQSLTRTPEYATNIITSAATVAALRRGSAGGPPAPSVPSAPVEGSPSSDLPSPLSPLPSPALRPLGTVPVKGRAEPVEIFAVEPPRF